MPKVNYALRTTSPYIGQPVAAMFDDGLAKALEDLLSADPQRFGQLPLALSGLPLAEGGLGVYQVADVSYFAHLSSIVDTWILQDEILHKFAGLPLTAYDQSLALLRQRLPSIDVPLPTRESSTAAQNTQHVLAVKYFSMKVEGVKQQVVDSPRITSCRRFRPGARTQCKA